MTKECYRTGGSNLRPLEYQSDAHPTELTGANKVVVQYGQQSHAFSLLFNGFIREIPVCLQPNCTSKSMNVRIIQMGLSSLFSTEPG